MKDIEQIKLKLSERGDLMINLNLLVDFCIENRVLTIEKSNKSFDIDLLLGENIVVESSGKYILVDNLFFAFVFYQKYTEKLKFSIDNDFRSTISFLKDVENTFNVDSSIREYRVLNRKLWTIAILDSNKRWDTDFLDFIKEVLNENKHDDLYSFNDGFSRALPSLKIEPDLLYKSLKLIVGKVNSDAHYNMPLGDLMKGIQSKVNVDVEFGIAFFDFVIKEESFEVNILIPIITGLYEKLGVEFYDKRVLPLLDNEVYYVSVICGFSNIKEIKAGEVELFLQLYDKFKLGNETILLNNPKLLFSLLKSKEVFGNNIFILECFARLKDLIIIKNDNILFYLLHQLQFIDGFENKIASLIVHFIKQDQFKIEKHLDHLDGVIWKMKSITNLRNVLYAIGKDIRFDSISKHLSATISKFYNEKAILFEKLLISLIIHNNPSFRYLGRDLLSSLAQHGYFKFKYDILKIDSLSQYKLWVSVCQNYQEPKYVIPCLIPLLSSKSEIVKEAFICKLEEYSANYGEGLTKVLKDAINIEEEDLNEILVRVKNYKTVFFQKHAHLKYSIKELDAYYTQNIIFNDYTKNYSRVFSREINKGTYENSVLLKMIKKVSLAKGGGWKQEGSSSISKLSKVSTSFSLPRDYFVDPEYYDHLWGIEISDDWKNRYVEIEKFLENE